MSDSERLGYSVEEIAAGFGIDQKTIRRGMEKGTIPYEQIGRRKIIPGWYVKKMRGEPQPEKAA